ncbi:hypothetical protein [Pseudomonas turukhanskensis]|nr:hypothetical protein [Pseudomonas turukhanskensis]
MTKPEDYISLESAIAALRRDSPEVLKAMAMAIKSFSASNLVPQSVVEGVEYGRQIPNFAITHGQLGAYLDLAVTKHASVLIETQVGVVQSHHVKVNREWLSIQREQAMRVPDVARAIARRFSGSKGATVTPMFPELEDQDPREALSELRKVKVRLERNREIPADDARDLELDQIRHLLAASDAKGLAVTKENASLVMTVKTLTLENDRLRKVRSESPVSSSLMKSKPISNVEVRNAAIRRARESVADVARALWSYPDFANCRTGEMAPIVRRSVDPNLLVFLPKTDVTLARWLTKDSAPPSAKRKGRPAKIAPKK